MAEQRKPIVKPKTPPPPPPKPKRTFAETGEYLVYNQVYNPPITVPRGAQPKEVPISTASPREGRLQAGQSVQTSPIRNKDAVLTSPPSRAYPENQGPPLPPRNAAMRTPGKGLPKSPVAESTPKKGIIRNVYARARDFFTRKSATTPYESLPQHQYPATSATTTPKKRGIFRKLFGGSTTPSPRQNVTTLSDTTSSPDRSYSGYSADLETSRLNDSSFSSSSDPRRGGPQHSPDFSSEVSVSYNAEAAGGRSGASIQGLRSSADFSSDLSASDLDDDDSCYARVERQPSGKLLSIQVNSPANIRVATSDSGEVTACIETASDRKKEEC